MKVMKNFLRYNPTGQLCENVTCLVCNSKEEIIFNINEDEIYAGDIFKELACIKRENQDKE